MRFGRGRGLSKFIENVQNGEPLAVTIAVGIGVAIAVYIGFKIYKWRQEVNSGSSRS